MIETSQGKMGSYLVESHLAVKWPFLSRVNTFTKITIKFEGVRECRASVVVTNHVTLLAVIARNSNNEKGALIFKISSRPRQ